MKPLLEKKIAISHLPIKHSAEEYFNVSFILIKSFSQNKTGSKHLSAECSPAPKANNPNNNQIMPTSALFTNTEIIKRLNSPADSRYNDQLSNKNRQSVKILEKNTSPMKILGHDEFLEYVRSKIKINLNKSTRPEVKINSPIQISKKNSFNNIYNSSCEKNEKVNIEKRQDVKLVPFYKFLNMRNSLTSKKSPNKQIQAQVHAQNLAHKNIEFNGLMAGNKSPGYKKVKQQGQSQQNQLNNHHNDFKKRYEEFEVDSEKISKIYKGLKSIQRKRSQNNVSYHRRNCVNDNSANTINSKSKSNSNSNSFINHSKNNSSYTKNFPKLDIMGLNDSYKSTKYHTESNLNQFCQNANNSYSSPYTKLKKQKILLKEDKYENIYKSDFNVRNTLMKVFLKRLKQIETFGLFQL